MNRTEEEEQARPLPPETKCRAAFTFQGVYKVDLPFEEGEELTILEPCSALFWYLAKNQAGRQGVVPVTLIEPVLAPISHRPAPPPPGAKKSSPPAVPAKKTDSPSAAPPTVPPHSQQQQPQSDLTDSTGRCDSMDFMNRPPIPPPPAEFPQQQQRLPRHLMGPPVSKYRNRTTFLNMAGWHYPSLDDVLLSKTRLNSLEALQKMRIGVYAFIHKSIPSLRYVAKSVDLYHELHRMFDMLYLKDLADLNPIEFQLQFGQPDASSWYLRVVRTRMEALDGRFNQLILQHESLAPHGLNPEFSFAGAEKWQSFCTWYSGGKEEEDPQEVEFCDLETGAPPPPASSQEQCP